MSPGWREAFLNMSEWHDCDFIKRHIVQQQAIAKQKLDAAWAIWQMNIAQAEEQDECDKSINSRMNRTLNDQSEKWLKHFLNSHRSQHVR